MSTTMSIGKIYWKHVGVYIPQAQYNKFNVVYSNGSSYLSLTDKNNYPLSNEFAWQLIVAKGDKGDRGEAFKYADFTPEQLTGLRGPVGKSFNIVGMYSTEAELKQAIPDGSDVDGVYAVGEAVPYLYYAWVVKNGSGDWVSQGQLQGGDGKSAYEIAVQNGYVGTEAEWLLSLKGTDGVVGADGTDGKSAYDLYRESVPAGTQPLTLSEWLLSLRGDNGKSAYDLYVESVLDGETPLTLEQWVASLKGQKGADGKSAYELYVESVPEGETPLTIEQWFVTLSMDVRVVDMPSDGSMPDFSQMEEGKFYLLAISM